MAKAQKRRAAEKTFSLDGETLRIGIKRILCVLLLLCAVIVSARTSWIVSTTLFDSDTSSELILGEKLAREGGILSTTWYYSTELQVIDCQMVYSLLFHLTSDWSMVRFWGAVLMQLMMLGAFGFLARQARIPFNRFCLAGAAMLLPFSVPYGRIVLYHSYYAFHMILANLTVGLYLGAVRRAGTEKYWKRWQFWLFAGLLCLVSFCAGLGGVRQLMVCTVPLFAAALLAAMVEEGKKADLRNRLTAAVPALATGLGAFAFSGLGYLVNLKAFSGVYSYADYSSQYTALGDFGQLTDVLRAMMSTLGFRDQAQLFSLPGLLGICGFLIWVVTLLLGIHTLRNTEDYSARYLSLFMLMTQVVMVCVFMLLAMEGFLEGGRMDLYFLPVTFWVIPALAKADLRPDSGMLPEEGEKKFPEKLFSGDARLSVHGLISLLVIVMLVANGLYYTAFFRDPATYRRDVEYSGLNYNDTENVASMTPVAEYLMENGYTLVYASYWDAAVLTELTDGKVKSVPVENGKKKHPIKYQNWMCDMNLRDPEYAAAQKAAIFANYDLSSNLGEGNKYGAVELTFFGGNTLFDLPDPAALAKDLAE